MTMRSWLPASCAVLALAVSVVVLWSNHRSPSKAISAADKNELAELRAELSRLQSRVANDEQAMGTLAWANARGLSAAPSAAASVTDGSSSPPGDVVRPPRPTRAQQIARFERHFSELDAQRGTASDVDMEHKIRGLLTDSSAQKLSALSKATIERISCGNQLCRIDMSFDGTVSARMGQTELRIQLAPLNHGATVYVDDDSGKLYAYFNTGSAVFPPFPSPQEVAAPDKGG